MKFTCVDNTGREEYLTIGKTYDGRFDDEKDEADFRLIVIGVCDGGQIGCYFSQFRFTWDETE